LSFAKQQGSDQMNIAVVEPVAVLQLGHGNRWSGADAVRNKINRMICGILDHRDTVGHGKRLFLIVSHQHSGDAVPPCTAIDPALSSHESLDWLETSFSGGDILQGPRPWLRVFRFTFFGSAVQRMMAAYGSTGVALSQPLHARLRRNAAHSRHKNESPFSEKNRKSGATN
jgi:hypothetical protein